MIKGKAVLIFRIVLGLAYIAMGVYVYSKREMLNSPWLIVLSCLFVIYGIWRIARSVLQSRKKDPEFNSI
jgi:hypothetical protein